MSNEHPTDITFEIFNYCNGSCTGCTLSANDRKLLFLNERNILNGLSRILDFGKLKNIHYRPVFSFGDVPKLEKEKQFKIYDFCKNNNLSFGLTVTLVDEEFNYLSIISEIIEQYRGNNLVFDLTIDPVRLHQSSKYYSNVHNFIKFIKQFKDIDLHLQILMSSYILEHYKPQELSDLLLEVSGNIPVFIGMAPTLENSLKKNYTYNSIASFDYLKTYYDTNPILKKYLKEEISRFKQGVGEFEDFLLQGFHIDSDLNLYPVNYSVFGDIVKDKRNNSKPLGNISLQKIEDILVDKVIKPLSVKNNIYLETSNFGCYDCEYFSHCKFYGVGLLRMNYKNFENKLGHCYGPKNIS